MRNYPYRWIVAGKSRTKFLDGAVYTGSEIDKRSGKTDFFCKLFTTTHDVPGKYDVLTILLDLIAGDEEPDGGMLVTIDLELQFDDNQLIPEYKQTLLGFTGIKEQYKRSDFTGKKVDPWGTVTYQGFKTIYSISATTIHGDPRLSIELHAYEHGLWSALLDVVLGVSVMAMDKRKMPRTFELDGEIGLLFAQYGQI